jgi:hypothetical protein
MRVARSSFDGDLPPDKLPLRDDEPSPDDEPRRNHDPLLLMVRISSGVGLNCLPEFSRFTVAERARESLSDGGSRVLTHKHPSGRYLYGLPLRENGPPKKFYG